MAGRGNPNFKPGVSGNPAGRKPGKSSSARIRAAIEKKSPELLRTVMNAALAGDMTAAKLLIDRVCPPLKAHALPINIESIPDSIAGQGSEIINATFSGQIPPDVGAQLIAALAGLGKIIEVEELLKRITALEESLVEKKENQY
ncbi:MAG: DUF5681 domain-containing protein [Methylococcaceae bacterium]|jgi:hypothetical protein